VRVAESHGTAIPAGPWGNMTGDGVIMGLQHRPPRLWPGGFPTGMSRNVAGAGDAEHRSGSEALGKLALRP
jgi:hypothetical protein